MTNVKRGNIVILAKEHARVKYLGRNGEFRGQLVELVGVEDSDAPSGFAVRVKLPNGTSKLVSPTSLDLNG